MGKQTLVFLAALFVAQVVTCCDCVKNVGDVVEEAKKQFQELKAIVQGDIMAAHDELANFGVDFLTYGDDVLKNGELQLQQEHETIRAQLDTLKELAFQANKNISVCLDVREEVLNRLPRIYGEQMLHCIGGKVRESHEFVSNAKYIIDININKINHLEHQIDACGESILCLQPIITEMQLDMIRLPQNIKTEVDATKALFSTLKLSVDECSTVKVSEYNSEANSLLGDITACINRIIGN